MQNHPGPATMPSPVRPMPISLKQAIETLRALRDEVPIPARLPTEAEVAAAEEQLDVRFPPDYRYFLLHGSDVSYGVLEPAQVTPDAGHTDLVSLARRAWAEGVPREFLPFCEDNADYFCLDADGSVAMLSHDGLRGGVWPDLADWIQDVWINDFLDMQNGPTPS
jgi:hypothetical protein